MNLFDSRVGRKFLVTVAVLTGLFTLMACDNIPSDDFRFLVLMVFGGYIGGNLGERMIDKKPKV